ncbi:protein-disulfide reductase DsbD family protein [Dyella agri]|uniref:Protein-disulfide reductase DsbD n=1 Tax=Dyella agri TaxID=1926869 RepID=A0ABW8KI08_9GAMM
MKACTRIAWVLLLCFVATLIHAQDLEGLLPIGEAYKLSADTGTPGVVKLHWKIAPDYYLYRGQMKFTGGDGVTLGEATLPDGKKYHDEYLGDVETYHDHIDASIPYTLAPGAQRIKLAVRYQGCHEVDPKICYPPYVENLDLPLPGTANAAAGQGDTRVAGAAASVAAATPVDAASANPASTGWLGALLLAFAGGLVLNLMPCVLPVLSIKAVGLLESGEDAAKARRHALTYTAGVLCAFAAIGLAIAALRSAGHALGWGAQLQQPLVVGALVCVMVAVGLSMSGVVQFGTSFGNLGQGVASRSGWAGDFFTGVLAVAVASPCVAPFMGTALAYAFVAPTFAALLVFLALGLGLASPFLLVGFVPALGRLLPRPGAWMETLKQVLAFPMYLTAVWLIWVLAHQRGADAVGLVLSAAVLLAMTLWWFERSRHRRMPARLLAVLLALLAVAPLYLLARLPPVSVAGGEEQGVVAFSPAKLAELRKAGTPVLVDMTADWCITCKANEHAVLDTPAFHDLLARTGAVYMKGDWTNVDPTISAFLQEYHSPGVPLYVVFPKGGGSGKVLPSVLTLSLMQRTLTQAAAGGQER